MNDRPEAPSASEIDLAGSVAIVTGGGAAADVIGNGSATAILLAQAGARVLIADIDESKAARTVAMIEDAGGEAAACTADVTDEAAAGAMVEAARSRWGRLDILVNNVGIASNRSVVDESAAEWERVMRTNVSSMFLASKFAIPAMEAGGRGGAIVNIGSIAAIRPRGFTAYSTSKGAVISLTRAMAIDHADAGIRANCVMPGPVYSSMVADKVRGELRETRRTASPLGIEGTGWDVAQAVRFLASPQARYITGQSLVVDGGVTLRAPAR
jgi:NAD(P)-dependent dehydrogenase (short-subunit alcohol dehydrogenase family)